VGDLFSDPVRRYIGTWGNIVLFASGFLFITHLLQSDYANGKDGYWYVIQLQSLIDKGELHSYESTLLYPLFFLFKLVTTDYTIALRYTLLTISLFSSLSLLYLYRQFFPISTDNLMAAKPSATGFNLPAGFNLIITLLLIFSPSVLLMAVQYPKQSLALSFLNFAFGLLLPATGKLFSPRDQNKTTSEADNKAAPGQVAKTSPLPAAGKTVTGLMALVLALLSHRLIPPLFGVVASGYFVFSWYLARLESGKPETRTISIRPRWLNKGIYLLGATAAGVVILLLFFPGVFHPGDLKRLATSDNLYSVFWQYWKFFTFQIVILFEAFAPFLLLFIAWQNRFRLNSILPKNPVKPLPFLITVSGLTLLFHLPLFNFYDLQVRLFASTLVYSYLMIPLFLRWLERNRWAAAKKVFIYGLALTSVLSVFHQSLFFYDPFKFEHDYPSFDTLINKTTGPLSANPPELVVAHTGLAQYFEFKTGFETLPWSPEERFDKKRTYRFVYGITKNLFLNRIEQYQSPLPADYKNEITQCNNDYILVREDLWVIFLQMRSAGYDEKIENALNYWKNPMVVRPSYLFK